MGLLYQCDVCLNHWNKLELLIILEQVIIVNDIKQEFIREILQFFEISIICGACYEKIINDDFKQEVEYIKEKYEKAKQELFEKKYNLFSSICKGLDKGEIR